MQLRLEIVSYRREAPSEASEHIFDGDSGVIGRESGDGVVWVLPDPSEVISRRHARIEFRGDQYFLTDISQNGMTDARSGDSIEFNVPVAIQDGDQFGIGDYVIAAVLIRDTETDRGADEEAGFGVVPVASEHGVVQKPSWFPSDYDEEEDDDKTRDYHAWVAGHRESLRGDVDRPPAPAEEKNYVPGPFGKRAHESPPARERNDAVAEDKDYVPGPFAGSRSASDRNTTAPEYRTGNKASSSDRGEDVSPRDSTPQLQATEHLDALLREVLDILGVPDLHTSAEAAPGVFCTMAVILREALAQTIEVLRMRDKFRYEHRIRGSVLYNNPLKFARSVEDAVDSMLRPRGDGQLPPDQAVRQTFMDILAHQAALMGALEGVVRGGSSPNVFDPAHLEQEWFQEISGLEHHLAMKRKAKLWDLYTERYRKLVHEASDKFEKEFEDRFAQAYTEQLASLRAAGVGGPVDAGGGSGGGRR